MHMCKGRGMYSFPWSYEHHQVLWVSRPTTPPPLFLSPLYCNIFFLLYVCWFNINLIRLLWTVSQRPSSQTALVCPPSMHTSSSPRTLNRCATCNKPPPKLQPPLHPPLPQPLHPDNNASSHLHGKPPSPTTTNNNNNNNSNHNTNNNHLNRRGHRNANDERRWR